MIETKICTKCEQEKEINEFYFLSNRKDMRRSMCKDCSNHAGKGWYLKNRERNQLSCKKWKENHPERKQYEKRINTPKGKIDNNISRAMHRSISQLKANRHWEDLVEFTVDQLKSHLEKLFTPKMTWENYGTYWHIDHKIPLSVFNFESPEDLDFKKCWSLKNLQPLEATENIKKHNRIDKPFQPSLLLNVA
jgi:hypothetical protein